MIFAGGSVVWDMEQWSIAKQTGIYFTLTAVAMFPISYMAGWMEHTLLDCVIYFGNICCYLCCYVAYSIFYLETKN